MPSTPYPPAKLMNRVGYLTDGPELEQMYESAGRHLFEFVTSTVAPHLDLPTASVLDLGCGAGRVLRHWTDLAADGTRVVGVDIDEPSIEWCQEHLAPGVETLAGPAVPPLALAPGQFDLVYALSLFTHLDRTWAEWLHEVHRLLKPGGIALLTVLPPDRMPTILGIEPDGREGIVTWGSSRTWDVGGPVVFQARWWVEEHWGRAFEVLEFDSQNRGTADLGPSQAAVLLRRRDAEVTPESLRAFDPEDLRERASAARNSQVQSIVGTLAFDDDHRLAPLARSLIEGHDAALGKAGLDISAEDDMYRYMLDTSSTAEQAIAGYFNTGTEALSVLDRVAEWHAGGWARVRDLLDVGSGYGRVSRLLVHRMSALDISVADIQPQAIQFQAATFGVTPIPADADGIHVPDGRRYAMVTVISLFTHLPRHRFEPWLTRVWELVAPDGVLVFSTHNADRAPREIVLEDGFGFVPRNEIPTLDVAEYGTTFTTDHYVRGAIASVCGPEAAATVQHLPLAFGGMQDVYAVSRGAATEPLDYRPASSVGALDGVRRRDGRTYVTGWAADVAGVRARPVAITVTLASAPLPVIAGGKRDDVAEHFGRPWDLDLRFSGWEVDVTSALDAADETLRVEVEIGGQTTAIYDGDLTTLSMLD